MGLTWKSKSIIKTHWIYHSCKFRKRKQYTIVPKVYQAKACKHEFGFRFNLQSSWLNTDKRSKVFMYPEQVANGEDIFYFFKKAKDILIPEWIINKIIIEKLT